MATVPPTSSHQTLQSPPPPPPPPKTAAPQPYPPSSAYTASPHQGVPPPVPPPPHAPSSITSPQATGGHSAPAGPAPPPEGWVPDVIKSMSKTDLAHLLQTPELLHALLHHPDHAHPSLKHSTATLVSALERTAQLAAQTDTMSQQLAVHREETSSHLLAARAAEQAWRRREGEMESALAPFAPRALHARLGLAIAEQEEVCRAVEEGWVEIEGVASEREVGEWVRRVREGRRLLEIRRERKARWDEGRVGGWR